MMVTLVTRDPCGLCGFLRRAFRFPEMRVNKRSMRSRGVTLSMRPGRCQECGVDFGESPRLRWTLDPESAAEVQAYRLRRWPELAAELPVLPSPVHGPTNPGGGQDAPLFTDKEAAG